MTTSHIPAIRNFAYRMTRACTKNNLDITDVIGFYDRALKLFTQKATNLQGLVFLIGGQIEAVAMWDVSNAENPAANIYVNLCNKNYSGLSEFVMKTISERALVQGIGYINVGGSETKGLDDYKRKYIPAFSIDLHSADAVVDELAFPCHDMSAEYAAI